jgi:hypothetical protein
MSETAKHTPAPWEWDAGDIGEDYSIPYCDVYAGDFIVAQVNGRQNAAFIVLSCNSHEALVAALEVGVTLIKSNPMLSAMASSWLEVANDALAQAKETE